MKRYRITYRRKNGEVLRTEDTQAWDVITVHCHAYMVCKGRGPEYWFEVKRLKKD